MSTARRTRLGAAITAAGLAIGGLGAAEDEPAARGVPRADASEGGARVELGARAGEGFRVADGRSGVSLRARLRGARDVAREDDGASARYRGVLGDGTEHAHVASADGTEDHVRLAKAPSEPALRYDLELGDAVAGLRLVGDVLELLDAGGAPRLRVRAPFVEDAAGARHAARLDVEGCAVDASPAAPWGRAPVDPGARTCALRVGWAAGLAAPLVVDPLWTATGLLAYARRNHTATRLANGRVLVAGGHDSTNDLSHPTAGELFDPTTQTWATTGSLATGRECHGAALLGDGRVLVATGSPDLEWEYDTPSVELYDPATGTFAPGPDLALPRHYPTATSLADGRVLVAGGRAYGPKIDHTVDAADVFDPKTGAWTSVGPMVHPRSQHGDALLDDGQVLLVGGSSPEGTRDDAELFDPKSGSFLPTGSLAEPRLAFATARAAGGRVVVAGGFVQDGLYTAGAEAFDPAKGAWSSLGKLPVGRAGASAATLPNGAVVVLGGYDDLHYYRDANAVFVEAGAFAPLPDMKSYRGDFTATSLVDGRVLVAGGDDNNSMALAEILTLLPQGTACDTAAACASGHCVEGVCCDAACDGVCVACTAATRGAGVDGQCGPVAKGTDPKDDCKDEGAATCGHDGLCDGNGACSSYEKAGGTCAPRPCATKDECASGNCVDGVCCDSACDGVCEACTGALKGHGSDGTCGPVARGTDPSGECASSADLACGARTICDGARACKPAKDVCAPYACAPAGGCAATCADDSGCADGARCEKGACLAITAGCDGDHTVTTASGSKVDCAPFRCGADGACKATCASVDDCAAPSVCDRDGRCVDPPTKPDESADRCTCGVAGAPSGRAASHAVIALAALALAARRRHARRGAPTRASW
jgi:hypothetical protein